VYHLGSDGNLYASISRGRRPNVINVDNDGSEILDDEIVLSYEIGYKALLADGRLSLDASLFRYDYENFQTSILEVDSGGTLVAETRDDGNATALGAEVQVQVQLSADLYAFVNAGWLDATFDDTDSEGNTQALAGNRFRLSPEYSFVLGFNYELALGKARTLYFSPNYTWKSQLYFEEDNQPGIEQGDYGLLNARAGFRLDGGRYEVALFGNNLLDKDFIIDAGNTGGSFGIPTFIGGPPRLFGVEVSARF
jgi:outer membrane receptor protein involved in Fe transport